MSQKYKIAPVDEFQTDGTRVMTELAGREIAVFRVEDEFYAVGNHCPHQSGPICEGKLKGRISTGDDGWAWEHERAEKVLTCPWHGWAFDVTTGENIQNDEYRVPTYETEVEDGHVYVKL